MKKILLITTTIAMALSLISCGGRKPKEDAECGKAKVYFVKDITPENIVKVYEALGREAKGKVAVKVSTGEAGNPNYLQPSLIKNFVQKVNGTIVECNTAYPGKRTTYEEHYQTAVEHGFTDIAKVDIMDQDGYTALPVKGGKHLTEDYVGSHLLNYDFAVILSHFKGHPMGGFGGALKNIAIGMASSEGKAWIHSAGRTLDPANLWDTLPEQDVFIECMAEACKGVLEHFGKNILYISIINNLTVDCDCVANPEPVCMGDIGIVASLDPIALDKACVDMIYNSEDHGAKHMIERIETRNGKHILDYGEQLGLGSQEYELITLE